MTFQRTQNLQRLTARKSGALALFFFSVSATSMARAADVLASKDLAAAPIGTSQPPDQEPRARRSAEDEAVLADERAECDLLRRRGEARKAIRRLDDLIEEDPGDAQAWLQRAQCQLDSADYDAAIADARAAFEKAGARPGATGKDAAPASSKDSAAQPAQIKAAALRVNAEALVTLGRADEALALLTQDKTILAPALDARDAWALGTAAWEAGQRDTARGYLEQGATTGDDQDWTGLLARGRCLRRLGRLEGASQSYVQALDASTGEAGLKGTGEPDVLAALGDLYFEADKEVSDAGKRSPAVLYREALQTNATHQGALLGLYALHRYNWQRQRESSGDILSRALTARPTSIPALVAAASADLDDGQLKAARERLDKLDKLAPHRRDVRTLHASLDRIVRRDDACTAMLAELAQEDPLDATPEREVGRHMLELYRFAEGLPFEKAAVARDAHDWDALTQLGRALANTGDEDGARDALDRAQTAAAGRQDAWRNNMLLVLKRIEEKHTTVKRGDLEYSWDPEGGEVLQTYLIPFYTEARAELSKRYGFTPTPTRIEVFREHKDFSVRSTGFEGFPALGVCFGPVVTAVSPLWEMRGTQSWARTSFHEFTHVIHLGLSHNRCPRWFTEGLATWEEVNHDPSWTRNMRRELVDSIANDDILRVRDLNRAFRGPRILFGYYQCGLMLQMLIERHGFAPVVKMLEAFDRGLDIDAALKEVYATTPEGLDAEFLEYVRDLTKELRIEPRWTPEVVARIQAGLSAKPPKGEKKLREWVDGWCTVAWGMWQQNMRIDAQEALRHAKEGGPDTPRALFLRADLALAGQDKEAAQQFFEQAFAAGGEDFRARIALASFAEDAHDVVACEKHLLAAQQDFPGFDDKTLSAELRLSNFYAEQKRIDDAMAARERWLGWNAGDTQLRMVVARWHVERAQADKSGAVDTQELERAITLYGEINEIDPFQREVHRAWGDSLRDAGRFDDALREYRMILAVPPTLDIKDHQEPLDDKGQAEVIGLQASCLLSLGKHDEALERAKAALALDPDCKVARETIEKLQ